MNKIILIICTILGVIAVAILIYSFLRLQYLISLQGGKTNVNKGTKRSKRRID